MEVNGKYYLEDIESGTMYRVTKEYHDWYKSMMLEAWEKVKPVLPDIKGKIMIFGTGGDFDNAGNDYKMFYQEINWKEKPNSIMFYPATWPLDKDKITKPNK